MIVGLAVAVRAGWCLVQADHLTTDPDAYVAISGHLATGEGYTSTGADHPTAFRPPLYPIVLTGLRFAPLPFPVAIALANILFGAATVALTMRLAERLGLGRGRLLAGAIMALDPLSVEYATYPMTECLSALLAVLLLNLSLPFVQGEQNRRDEIILGFACGLAVLCRPTFWAFVVLLVAGLTVWRWRSKRHERLSIAWRGVAALFLVVSPWLLRNLFVFGTPIVMTTHGGYTLLLANNPVFYEEVVAQPWGTVWDGESLGHWQNDLEDDLQQAGINVRDEVARNRFLGARARQVIAANPRMFARACWLRLRRFYAVTPLKGTGKESPVFMQGLVGLFNTSMLLATLCGLAIAVRAKQGRWLPVLCLLCGFTLVHAVYWTNARMRTPIVPAIAVLATLGAATVRARFARRGDSR